MATINDLITPVHLKEDNSNATRIATPPTGQAFPLFDDGMLFNYADIAALKIARIRETIKYLKVNDATHARYIPGGGDTFCNIYAYDLSYLMGSKINKYFIPRVWWTQKAIDKIKNNVPQTVTYGTTVNELNANGLYQWFKDYGSGFGWVAQNDLNELQEYVNSTGEIGIIVGKKSTGHGHITVVIPEQSAEPTGVFGAIRKAGKVINPLQSQAGAINFEYGNSTIGGSPWFNAGGHVSSFYIFNRI